MATNKEIILLNKLTLLINSFKHLITNIMNSGLFKELNNKKLIKGFFSQPQLFEFHGMSIKILKMLCTIKVYFFNHI